MFLKPTKMTSHTHTHTHINYRYMWPTVLDKAMKASTNNSLSSKCKKMTISGRLEQRLSKDKVKIIWVNKMKRNKPDSKQT